MPKPSRRTALPPAPPQPDLTDLDWLVDEPAKEPLKDPARVAAALLLGHALAAAGTTVEDAGRDGALCVVLVPAACWAEVTREEWRTWIRGGGGWWEGTRDLYRDGVGWVAWLPEEQPRPSDRLHAADAFAMAVSQGRHCAGFAADASWLPTDLVLAADHRLTLTVLTGADVALVARELCGGEATKTLADEQAALLTPRLLRLARRLGQTADAYVCKLRDLLHRELAPAGPAAKESPRDAPTLDRLHGMDEAVAWGLAVAHDLQAFRDGTLAWADVDRGCLLSGPPGCGKTLFARALAATCGVPLVSGSYGQWLGTGNAHQGDLLKSMRKTFADARSRAPSILFIDEVDSFPNRGTIRHRYAEWDIQVVNALLAEIDGVEGREGVVLVAACNHPEKLDPALVRSGRLDRHVRIGLPDRGALALILREHLGDDLPGEDLSGAALAAAGASGADCERLVRGARRRARAAGRAMTVADLVDEIGGADDRSPDDLWIAAVHEAGHAVVASTLRPGSLGMVSLHGMAESGGRTRATLVTSVFLRAADVQDQLVMTLAGRAAEQEVFGIPSSASGGYAASDLARATGLAVVADTALGLGREDGLVWRGRPDVEAVPEMLASVPALVDRVRTRLDEAYTAARELVRQRLMAVEAVASALVARRVLDGPEAEDIVRRSVPADGAR